MLVPVHQTILHRIPEDSKLHNDGHENLTSHIKKFAHYGNCFLIIDKIQFYVSLPSVLI
jgi:hypothetical protein